MIPNVIHLLFGFSPDFGGIPFSLVHYLAVRSMYEVNRPDAIYLYYAHEPSGEWWERARPYLTLVTFSPPTSIAGRPLRHVAHQADVARLELLYEHGGIYLDLDVICVRPFTPLLDNQCVLGIQKSREVDGLCASVILAAPKATFLRRWLDGFDPSLSLWAGFRSTGEDRYWDEYSVRYPSMLARRHPTEVHVEGYRSFFWPSWRPEGLRLMFETPGDGFPDAYCHHLWEQAAWSRYLEPLTVEELRHGRSNFAAIVRRFLPEC